MEDRTVGRASSWAVADMELDEFIGPAIQAARKEGAQEVEVYAVSAHSWSAYADDSKVKSVEEKNDLGIAIRLLRDHRFGQSASIVSSIADAEACARNAARVASLLPLEKTFKSFPKPDKPGVWARCSDENVRSLENRELAQLMSAIIGATVEAGKVKVPNGVLRAGHIQARVVNTNGIDVCRESTLVYLRVSAMTEGANPGEGAETCYSTRINDLDPSAIGKNLRQKATTSAKAEGYKGRMQAAVIIPPSDLAEMFSGSVSFALSMENVNRKRSPWAGKVGQPVASKAISFTDDPTDERGVLSSPFDDEGVPTRKKAMVKDGVLVGFVNDAYNAYKSDSPMTGNGIRRNPMELVGQWQTPVSIAPLNLVLKKGDLSVDDIVSSIDKGILVDSFASPDVHPITGAFGLEVRCGHLIQNGSLTRTVKHCLITGNMFEALHKVRAVGNDAVTSLNHILPSVCFDDLELVGSE
jgi:PmbA protein